MPAAGKSPEEWIDHQVVLTWASSSEFLSPDAVLWLDGISDWGIVVSWYSPGETGELETITAFYPWGAFSAIRLAREDELLPT